MNIKQHLLIMMEEVKQLEGYETMNKFNQENALLNILLIATEVKKLKRLESDKSNSFEVCEKQYNEIMRKTNKYQLGWFVDCIFEFDSMFKEEAMNKLINAMTGNKTDVKKKC